MPFTVLPVSLGLAAACALVNLWLAFRIGQVRRREKVFLGDGGAEPVVRRMRAQANFIENAPLVVVLVALIEVADGPTPWLHVLAGLFVVARILHPIGMDGWFPGRLAGTATTFLIELVLAVWALTIAAGALHHPHHAASMV